MSLGTLHFTEQPDPPIGKAMDMKSVCGKFMRQVVPLWGEDDSYTVCQDCESNAGKSRRYRAYLFPAALLRKREK